MAGITDGKFCRKLSTKGFDLVTIGGYNSDRETILAGKKIIKRGRSEFDVPLGDFKEHITHQTDIIKKDTHWKGMVSVNLRAVTTSPIIEISEINEVDVVEINAHCRQPEITGLGCGQSLLFKPEKLERFTHEVVKKADSKVSVKIRANVQGTDIIEISKSVENAGADYLHVDAMKPGHPQADYDVISSIKQTTEIFLIGNNSIKDLKSAQKMIDAGSDGISLARALITGKLPFDLSLVKFNNSK
ncbi:MAG: tRNA-dihydrouridine synthase [Methanobacterium sp.]|nr:tRNA-dihydrouridine synthase [Methanobacterium sp.]